MGFKQYTVYISEDTLDAWTCHLCGKYIINPSYLFLTLPRVWKKLFKVCLSINIGQCSEGPHNLSNSEGNFCTKMLCVCTHSYCQIETISVNPTGYVSVQE